MRVDQIIAERSRRVGVFNRAIGEERLEHLFVPTRQRRAPEVLRIELNGMTVHGAGENRILPRHPPRERIVRVARHSAFDDVHPDVLMREFVVESDL